MSITAVRRTAQETVHRTFGVPSKYLREGYRDADVTVRLHQAPMVQGDLDREGYAMVREMGSVIIFLISECPEVENGHQWKLEDGRTFEVANTLPRFDTYRGFVEVVEVKDVEG